METTKVIVLARPLTPMAQPCLCNSAEECWFPKPVVAGSNPARGTEGTPIGKSDETRVMTSSSLTWLDLY